MRTKDFFNNPWVWVGGATLFVIGVLCSITFFPLQPVAPGSENAVIPIQDPGRLQMFYGTLNNAPHTYEFSIAKTQTFDARILMPITDSEKTMASAILIKEPEGKGRVTEIARLTASSETPSKEYFGALGNSLYQGPTFSGTLPPGDYRLEVHTPNNNEQYVLETGSKEDGPWYGAFLAQLVSFKHFAGASVFLIFVAPVLLLPLLLAVGLGWMVFVGRTKRDDILSK